MGVNEIRDAITEGDYHESTCCAHLDSMEDVSN
jgi:hypothetical protein